MYPVYVCVRYSSSRFGFRERLKGLDGFRFRGLALEGLVGLGVTGLGGLNPNSYCISCWN